MNLKILNKICDLQFLLVQIFKFDAFLSILLMNDIIPSILASKKSKRLWLIRLFSSTFKNGFEQKCTYFVNSTLMIDMAGHLVGKRTAIQICNIYVVWSWRFFMELDEKKENLQNSVRDAYFFLKNFYCDLQAVIHHYVKNHASVCY